MRSIPSIPLLVLVFGGCAMPPAPALGIRVLSSEAAGAPVAELVSPSSANFDDEAPRAPAAAAPTKSAPKARIGAPGGSGAGSRRVAPAQSGKDTVGGLPAGIGGGTGPRG